MNRCGSSGEGGVTREVEPDRCHLVRMGFLGAMEVDLCGRYAKNTKKKREEVERVAKWRVEEKMIGHAGIYGAQNISRFAAVKSVYAVA